MSNAIKIVIIAPMREPPAQINSEQWMIDPNITYLNHGSFGARTVDIYETQLAYKKQFESSPVHFLDRQRHLVHNARKVVAAFVGAEEAGFGFVENATTGVGSVMHSLELSKHDEILTTNHVYNGVRQLIKHHCQQNNLLYREVDIQVPILSSEAILASLDENITSSTKLLVIDHVSSSTSVVFPILEIVKLCRNRGILVLVDGAHAPGMLNLDIDALAPDWYVANLHKWVCAPLGAAFVWAKECHRKSIHPMTISHWHDEGIHAEFDWQGTRDISAWLTSADAVRAGDFYGWSRIREHNHQMVLWMQDQLLDAWGVESLTPLDGSMLGSMATVPLPQGAPSDIETCLAVRDYLYEKHAIEVPVIPFHGRGMVRISCQLYSKPVDITVLISAIKEIKS
ncbi:MAG: aminotransferase class V-fold PLP-dependent enzyme [Phycisphaerae bacterium]|nr:aminotransferase class V-fold PLP-dependent enzyme [Phycisphaerae bacterium]